MFVVIRFAYDDDSGIVATGGGGCTHSFVVVTCAYGVVVNIILKIIEQEILSSKILMHFLNVF